MRKSTVLPSSLRSRDFNTAKLDLKQIVSLPFPMSSRYCLSYRLVVRQIIHRRLCNVQSIGGVIDGKNEDLLAGRSIRDAIAHSAVRRVPASNFGAAANVWEAWDVGLLLPAVAGDQAVCTVGAGDDVKRAVALRVARVVGERYGAGERGHEGEQRKG